MTVKNKTKIQVQMDKDLADNAKLVLDALGATPTTFITMAYKRLVAERQLPFDTKLTREENDKLNILMESKKQKHTVLDTPEKVKKWSMDE